MTIHDDERTRANEEFLRVIDEEFNELTDEDRGAIRRLPLIRDLFVVTATTGIGTVVIVLALVRFTAGLVAIGSLIATLLVAIGANLGLSVGYCVGLTLGAAAIYWLIGQIFRAFTGDDG